MPSSKFNRLPTPRLRPAICFPPPGSCKRKYIDIKPLFIIGHYRWVDWHPPVPVDLYGQITMQWYLDDLCWWGGHTRPGTLITLELYAVTFPDKFSVRMDLHIDPDQDLFHFWTDLPFNNIFHIDTGPLTMVNEVDKDYREAWVVG